MPTHSGPARRHLHMAYNCADGAAATAMFVDGLALRNTMSSAAEPSSQDLLGFGREVTGGADFVYDARGPRGGPAIEVNYWVDPPVVGAPHHDPTTVGLHAMGFSVPDIEEAVARLNALGCNVIGSGPAPFGDGWMSLRDPRGVAIDLVSDASVPVGETRMRHLRGTVSEMAASLSWYEGLGYEVIARTNITEGSFVGHDGTTVAEAARLRLPDDPFEVFLMHWETPATHGSHYAEPNHGGLYRVALCVDDTRAAYNEMAAGGWTFARPPELVELKGTPVPDMWICFLRDPDGVLYEFVERPRSAFKQS
jgi:catechol 2,3-dioxygenase-like lactoylglutathione lyase family enzyme